MPREDADAQGPETALGRENRGSRRQADIISRRKRDFVPSKLLCLLDIEKPHFLECILAIYVNVIVQVIARRSFIYSQCQYHGNAG